MKSGMFISNALKTFRIAGTGFWMHNTGSLILNSRRLALCTDDPRFSTWILDPERQTLDPAAGIPDTGHWVRNPKACRKYVRSGRLPHSLALSSGPPADSRSPYCGERAGGKTLVVTELSLEGKCRGLSLTVRLTVKVRVECAKSPCLFTL